MTTGTERRLNEINHPEQCLSSGERKKLAGYKEIDIFTANALCIIIMIVFAIVIIKMGITYHSFEIVIFILTGMILNVIIVATIAYYLGKRMGKFYEKKVEKILGERKR